MKSFGFYANNEGVKPQHIFPFSPCELSSSCWSDQDAYDVWQDPAVARAGPDVLQSWHVCTCARVYVCDCVHVFSKHWPHIQHLCLGCVWSPGPQQSKVRGVWMLNVRAALCVSLCTSAPPSQLKNNTLHSLHSLTALQRETHRVLCCCWWLLLMQKTGDHVHEDPDLPRIEWFISLLIVQRSLHIVCCPVLLFPWLTLQYSVRKYCWNVIFSFAK